MAHKLLTACLLLGLAAAGCGKKDQAANESVDLAALRARRDSIQLARQRADSVARVRYQACSDSVTAELKKTSAGRRKLAAKRPAGTALPELEAACGTPPAPAASDTSASPQVTAATRDTSTAAPPAAAAAPATNSAASVPAPPDTAAAQPARPAQAARDSLARQDSLSRTRETEIQRETFSYSGGNRDPFVSLINLPKLGPDFVDLQLVAIYQDLRYGRNSVAVIRDKDTKKRYNVRVGDQIGRMKIAQIRQRDVVLTIEDLGFERQETLSLRKREEDTP